MRGAGWILLLAGGLSLLPVAHAAGEVDLGKPDGWRLQVSEGGQAALRTVAGPQGPGLCVDWDFGTLPGSWRLLREAGWTLPAHARIRLDSRIDAHGAAQASLLLVDGQDRAWALHRPVSRLERQWQELPVLASQLRDGRGHFLEEGAALSVRSLQWRLASPHGGRGQWCLSDWKLETRPPDSSPLDATALADTATALQQRMADGRTDTLWVSSGVRQQTLSLDLGRERDIGGLQVQWAPGMRASDYTVQASLDGRNWRGLRQVRQASGNVDALRLGPLPARYLRLDLENGPNWRYGIIELAAQPPMWGRTLETWLQEVGRHLAEGSLPASLSGGPVQLRAIGAPGALAPAWFSHTGVVEPLPGQFSIEPWLQLNGQWQGPGAVQARGGNRDGGALSEWQQGGLKLQVLVQPGVDAHGRPWLQLDYQLGNAGSAPVEAGLGLLLRPFQLLPDGRWGDLAGGAGGLHRLQLENDRVLANGRLALVPPAGAKAMFARHFEAGLDAVLLRSGKWPQERSAEDEQGLASGAMVWQFTLAPSQQKSLRAWVPLLAEGMAAVAAPVGFRPSVAPPRLHLPDGQGDELSRAWQQAVARILAERAGSTLRVDSRLALGAGNRDAMALADALLLAGEQQAVTDWLMARIASGSTRQCAVLAHWATLAGSVQAADGWGQERLSALQAWLPQAMSRLEESGSCRKELAPENAARALQALASLLPAPPVEAGVPAVPAVPVGAAQGVPGQDTPEATAGAGSLPPLKATAATDMESLVVPALPPVGPAAPAADRRERWRTALQAIPADDLPAGWQRCTASACSGLADARQAAAIVQAIGALLVARDEDHLRLLPGLPAELWGKELELPGLGTRWGRLALSARRQGDDWVIEFGPGLRLPPAGLVIDWPWRDRPGQASADGVPLSWERGRLRLESVPFELRIALPSSLD